MIYKDIKDNTLLKFINDNIDALIYVIDMDTHEILYSNQKTAIEFGHVDGYKCYEKLQSNQLEPCEFCPPIKIRDIVKDEKLSYTWEHHNTLNNRVYLFRDLIVNLDNRMVKIQVGIDITKEKELEKKLIEEKNYSINSFEALTNATIEGLIISDETRVCIQVNDTVCEILGYSKEEIIGKNILDFVAEKSKLKVQLMIQNLDQEPYEAILIKKDKTEFPAILRGKDITLNSKTIRVSAILDITLVKEKEKKIETLAYYDALTSLANRTLLLDRLEIVINQTARSKNFAALMFVDLDHFKMINDLRGHLFGDLLLKQCANRLSHIVRKGDTVARFGGDEFVILLDTQTQIESNAVRNIETIATKVLYELSNPFIIEGSEFKIGASVGIMTFSGDQYSIDELLKFADNAMYHSKEMGRGQYSFFDEKLQEKNGRKKKLIDRLTLAIKDNKIDFYFQKQIDKESKTIGIELLSRWIDEELGEVSANEFISMAIEIGVIEKIDEMVLNKAISLIRLWENDKEKKEWQVSINVSLKQFERKDYIALVKAALEKENIPLGKLRIEITENLFYKNEEEILRKVADLKDMGIRLSIDDFATGYFSLPYLKRLSIDEIKIDRQFTENILTNKNDEAVILSILEIAKKFNFKLIVEGVETKEIFDRLIELGFDNFQGYYIGMPQSLDQI